MGRKLFMTCWTIIIFTIAFVVYLNVGTELLRNKYEHLHSDLLPLDGSATLMLFSRSVEPSVPEADLAYLQDFADLGTLQFSQVLFRHGDRTPLTEYPNDPNRGHDYGVKGFGQLTHRGQKRAIELGKYLRSRYDGYLDSMYSYDQVFTQSSDRDRTIMTAQLVLAGMFQPTGPAQGLPFQPVPVHSISRTMDNKLGFNQVCPKLGNLTKNYLESPTIRDLDTENAELYRYVGEMTGLNVTSYLQLYHVHDTLLVEADNGLDLPAWTKGIHPDQTRPIAGVEFTVATTTAEMRRLCLGPLMTQLTNNMEVHLGLAQWTKEESEVFRRSRLFLYSAHDTTISNFLNSLGLFDGESPGYASAVILELHKRDQDDEAYVKLFYKKYWDKEALELQVPNCGNPCGLNSFKKIYADLLIQPQQWTYECSLEAI